MKHLIFAFASIFLIPAIGQSADLNIFGLSEITPITALEGSTIRGAGSVSARTTGSAGLTATVLDPDSGSIWNFNVTQFNQTTDDKNSVYANQYRSALSSTFSDLVIGFGDVGITLGEFQFQMNGAAARASARTSAGELAQQIFQQ